MQIQNLININRIDIIIGIEYVDFYENQYNTNFFIDLYLEHKYSWNKLKERNFHGREDFLKRFNTLIDSIKHEGNKNAIFTIKCENEYWVVDGFHRASILYYYNLPLNVKIKEDDKVRFYYYPTNIYFFKNKMPGTICKLDLKYCNYTMLCLFKQYYKEFSTIILFPNKINLSSELQTKIKNDLIYEISISSENLSNNFKNNFIQMLYYNESWCKGGGYKKKADMCFDEEGYLKIIFIKKKNINDLNELKANIRKYYNKGKNSIHTPDKQEECDYLLQLLNENTITYMCKTPSLYVKFNNFNRLLIKLKEFCKSNDIDKKKICITSSSVLSIYGLRDCRDMDLFIDRKYIDIFKNSCFDNHNIYSIKNHYSNHFEDIIYNPENHFYYENFKFCELSIIYRYKKYRIEKSVFSVQSCEKDKRDINDMVEKNYINN